MSRYFPLTREVFWRQAACIVGPKEGQGPLAPFFDRIEKDDLLGQTSFEQAEMQLQLQCAQMLLQKENLRPEDISLLLSGDLLNQVVAAGFCARELKIPYLGLYGACSTMAESLMLGSMVLSAGYGTNALCMASSHFSTAERQYRFPLEMGTQRPPSAQWTVTGAGAALISTVLPSPLVITGVTPGRVIDLGITDANHMGAAMAPAAADTLEAHFRDSHTKPSDYDRIITGDLGQIGSDLVCEMLHEKGYDIAPVHMDCGVEIFRGMQLGSGGSGCGCCAVTLAGFIRNQFMEGTLKRILFTATGALLSPTTTQQGESIPSIAHAVVIERRQSC